MATSRIVVGFDGSSSAAMALTWAVGEASLRGAKLIALAVLDPPSNTPLSRGALSQEARESAPPPEILNPLREKVHKVAGDSAIFRFRHGAAAEELVAASSEADLLVVGSRGRNPLAGLLLGSVARACLLHARCPVVVVRPGPLPEPCGRVIVGLDASDHSRRALRVAAQEAGIRGAELVAVHAVFWDRLGTEMSTPRTEQLVELGQAMVAAELERCGVTATPAIVPGHPTEVLARQAERADLLVLGSRGHNPMGIMAGSTSSHLARHARCPVMVVRTLANGAAPARSAAGPASAAPGG